MTYVWQLMLEYGSLGLSAIVLGYTVGIAKSKGILPYAFMVFGLCVLAIGSYFDKTNISRSDIAFIEAGLADIAKDIGEAKKHKAGNDSVNLGATVDKLGNNVAVLQKRIINTLNR